MRFSRYSGCKTMRVDWKRKRKRHKIFRGTVIKWGWSNRRKTALWEKSEIKDPEPPLQYFTRSGCKHIPVAWIKNHCWLNIAQYGIDNSEQQAHTFANVGKPESKCQCCIINDLCFVIIMWVEFRLLNERANICVPKRCFSSFMKLYCWHHFDFVKKIF